MSTQFRQEAADPQPKPQLVSADVVRQHKLNESIVAEQKRHGITQPPKTHGEARDAMLRELLRRSQG